jgi:hypothetical protein
VTIQRFEPSGRVSRAPVVPKPNRLESLMIHPPRLRSGVQVGTRRFTLKPCAGKPWEPSRESGRVFRLETMF